MLVLWGIAMEKIRTSVKIAGKEYALTSYDSAQYVQRLGVLVDRRLTEMALSTRLNSNQVAVLTAVKIADDMLKAQDEVTRLRRELGQARQELVAAQKELIALRAKNHR